MPTLYLPTPLPASAVAVGRLVTSASGRLSKRSVESMAALVAAAHRLLGLVREIGGGGGGVGGGRRAQLT